MNLPVMPLGRSTSCNPQTTSCVNTPISCHHLYHRLQHYPPSSSFAGPNGPTHSMTRPFFKFPAYGKPLSNGPTRSLLLTPTMTELNLTPFLGLHSLPLVGRPVPHVNRITHSSPRRQLSRQRYARRAPVPAGEPPTMGGRPG